MIRIIGTFGLMLSFAFAGGCSQQQSAQANSADPKIDGSQYLLADEPEGAVGVIIAREDAKDGDDIVLVARVGGRKNPWIEGRAAFTVIDAAMSLVADGEESGEGEVCMDDCCASLRAECTTLVKFLDENGRPLQLDARELLRIKENDMVVVRGNVQRNVDDGTFAIVGNGLYVRE